MFIELTVMPEFCSSGIWDDRTYMIDFEDLNLSPELIKEFEDWIDFYDRKCHTKDIVFISKNANELNEKGKELAKKLKLLFPDTKVFYRGEIENEMLEKEEILL